MYTREQQRAAHAYRSVEGVSPGLRDDYVICVKALGANVIRSGLAATMAFLERDKERDEVKLLLRHLAQAQIPGLEDCDGSAVPSRIRAMKVDAYMLATREFMQVVVWFRRAVQAKPWQEGGP